MWFIDHLNLNTAQIGQAISKKKTWMWLWNPCLDEGDDSILLYFLIVTVIIFVKKIDNNLKENQKYFLKHLSTWYSLFLSIFFYLDQGLNRAVVSQQHFCLLTFCNKSDNLKTTTANKDSLTPAWWTKMVAPGRNGGK